MTAEQLAFELPTFNGRTVGDVHLKLSGNITCAVDQVPGDYSRVGEFWLLCRAHASGVGIKLGDPDADGPTWVNNVSITEAFRIDDDDLATSMRDDIRSTVEASIDKLAGRAKLPLDAG